MKWTVTYRPSADEQLAELWLNATDRQAISSASNAIARQLASDPLIAGESREDNLRILIEPPIAVIYDVSELDRLVSVWSVTEWH
jgi:hypothetical protein